jgi:RNA polymerase sigma-70 factor, ECF subfamily
MNEEELVRRYGRMVYNLSLSLAGDRVEAEDLAQESLVKAVRGLKGFEGRSTLASWIYRITVNAYKNRLRAKASRRALSLDAEGDDGRVLEIAATEAGPEVQALTHEKRRLIAKALERLSPDERAVLVLRELDGLSYAEIADSLEMPLGTVKSRLARARDVLAQFLSPEDIQ